jgi:anti-sigma B factor antagonist
MEFNFITENKNGAMIISLKGELIEKEQAKSLIDEIQIILSEASKNIILNLEELKYMNSTGLNVLINILTRCRNSGGDVVVCSLSAKVKQLFLITKLNSVFTVCNSMEEAFNYLKIQSSK